MPLGAARLNFLSKYQAPSGPSRSAITVTANGNAQISTSQSKFGGASGDFDGTGDYLTTDCTVPTDNWTVEFWFRSDVMNSSYYALCEQGLIGSTRQTGYFFVTINNSNNIRFRVLGISQTTDAEINSSTISANTWYHLAVTKSGSTVQLFLDGVSQGTDTVSYNTSQASSLQIGKVLFFSDYNGYMDEFRVSSIVRYTTAFTPSATAFANDADTIMLLHMDGTNGSTTFTDDNT